MRPIGGSEARLFRAGRDAFKCFYTVSRQCKTSFLLSSSIHSLIMSLRSDFNLVVVEGKLLLAIEYMPGKNSDSVTSYRNISSVSLSMGIGGAAVRERERAHHHRAGHCCLSLQRSCQEHGGYTIHHICRLSMTIT